MSASLKAHLALFSVALIFGANFSIAKVVMDDDYIQPLTFILLRILCALLLFQIFHGLFVKEKVERRDQARLVLCGLVGVASNQMLFFSGLKWTTPINASLIMTTAPIYVFLISFLVLKEPITLRKALGILLGATGAILLITYGKKVSLDSRQLLGDVMVFGNALCYGSYLVLAKSLMEKYHPMTVIKWVFTYGALFALPFGIPDLPAVEWATFSRGIWLSFFYVLICSTFLAYLFNSYALKQVSPSVVSFYIYLQPLMAAVIALMMGKDQLNQIKVLAGLLIFAGVYLVSTWKKKVQQPG